MGRSTVRVALVVMASVAVVLTGQEVTTQRARATDAEVSVSSRIDAVVMLARREKLALGFEYAGPELFESLRNASDRAHTLDALLPMAKGFRVTRDQGVLIVGHRSVPGRSRNLLDTRLKTFSTTRRMHIEDVSSLLWGYLVRQLLPTGGGIAGSRLGAVTEDTSRYIGPIKLDNVTVREALNTIGREHGEAAWIVTVAPSLLDTRRKTLKMPLWIVAEFDESGTKSFGQEVQARLSRVF